MRTCPRVSHASGNAGTRESCDIGAYDTGGA
jgi:hypothetical protein